MGAELNALFIHGVGQQPATYAKDASAWLAPYTGHHQVTWWAPFADKLQQAFSKDVDRRGSVMGPLQRLSAGTLADALMYLTNPHLKAHCGRLLDADVAKFKGQPFTCFAHSLGGLIFADWLRARPSVKGVRLVTLGCNLGLFYQGRKWAPVPQLTQPGSWVNLFTPRDMLGFPVAGLVGPHVKDVKVSVGGLLGWTGLSHISYWDSEKLWRKAVPAALGLRRS